MRSKFPITFLIVLFLLFFSSVYAFPMFLRVSATSPVNAASNDTNQSYGRDDCYTGGYYYLFYNNGSNYLNYVSSPNGSTWAHYKTVANVGVVGAGFFSVYCDSSQNVYFAWSESTSQWKYQIGSASAGVITWGAGFTKNCVHNTAGECQVYSVFAFNPSNVWVAIRSSSAEIWNCIVSLCTTSTNWAESTDIVNGCFTGCKILGLSNSSNLAVITLSGLRVNVNTTSNGGASWTSGIKTSAPLNFSQFVQTGCVAAASTVYCANFDTSSHKVYFLSFLQGAGSWTETAIDTFASNPGIVGWFIATDGSNLVITYPDTTAGTIDFQSSNNMGISWSGRTALVSGETISNFNNIQCTPTLQGTQAGVTWYGGSSHLRFALTSPFVTMTTTTVSVTATVTSTSIAATQTLTAYNTPNGVNWILLLFGLMFLPMTLWGVYAKFRGRGSSITFLTIFSLMLGALILTIAEFNSPSPFVPLGIAVFYIAAFLVYIINSRRKGMPPTI